MCRDAALAVELRRYIECPATHTGSILDIEQGLVSADKWSLDKLLSTICASDGVLAVGIAECSKYIESLCRGPAQIYLICVCVRLTIGGVDVYILCIALLVDNYAVVELRAEVVEADCHILVVDSRECLCKRSSGSQRPLHAVEVTTKRSVKDNAATGSHNADVVGNNICWTITQTGRATQHGCRSDVPLDVSARSYQVLAEVGVVVVTQTRHNRELFFNIICVLGISSNLTLVAVEVAKNIAAHSLSPRSTATPSAVGQSLVHPTRGCRDTCRKQRVVCKVVGVHQVEICHLLTARIALICAKEGILAEVVVIHNHRHI